MSNFKNFFTKITNKIKSLYKNSSNIIGIDLGTANTLICTPEKGIILNEASTISYITENGINSGYLYGTKAKELIGKTPFKIEVINPVDDGVVSYSNLTEDMVRKFLSTVIKENMLFQPIIICGVPFSATDVEKKALQEILERCNAKEALLVYESIASAVGANLQIDKPIGSLIIDIGGGTTEISVISLGGIIKNRTFKYGGRKIDKSIIEFIEHKYKLLIGENTAEEIKKQISCVYLKQDEEPKKMLIHGRNLKTNVPQEIVIDQNDLVYALAEFTNILVDNLNQILQSTQPELMKDIIKNGVTICGGGAKIGNLDYVIEKTTGLKSTIPNNPELCLINGLQKIISNYKQYNYLLFKQI